MDGVEIIRAERQRQIEEEGWTPEHDDMYTDGQLTAAAACYAMAPEQIVKRYSDAFIFIDPWPWDPTWDKRPRDTQGYLKEPTREERKRMLAKAGALIAAELDRILREEK